jgi:hypothetical protein
MQEGAYDVQVTVKDSFSVSTGESASASYTANSRVVGTGAVISPTSNPLVALYSAPPSVGSSMSVEFSPAGPNPSWRSTAPQPIVPGASTNFLVAGLLPNTSYQMRDVLGDGTTSVPISFTTGSLPTNLTFPNFSVQQGPAPGSDLSQDMVYHIGLPGAANYVDLLATDLAGNVDWYYDPLANNFNGYAPSLVPGGTFFMLGGPGLDTLREFDLAGDTLRETNITAVSAQLAAIGKDPIFNFNHDAQRLPNGDTAVIAATRRTINVKGTPTMYTADMVIVLDQNFQVAWAWDALDWLDPNRLPPIGEGPGDFTHANSVSWSPEDGDLLVSLRSQDWVLKIAYSGGTGDGHIVWRLGQGGDFTLTNNRSDPSLWFTHQHDARYVNDTTLVVFDDGNTRRQELNPNADSRGQALVLNEQTMQATLVVNADLGNYSFALGSGEVLPNGSLDFTSGVVGQSIEVSPDGTTNYDLYMTPWEYRSYFMHTLYGGTNRFYGLLDTGFEDPSQATGASGYTDDPTGSAWTFRGTAGLAGNGSSITRGNPYAPEGSQVAFLQGAGTVSQVVNILAAGTYQLRLSAAQGGKNGTRNESVQVQVDGTVVAVFTPTGTSYATYTIPSFDLTAGSHTITFVGIDPAGQGETALLDQVSLSTSPMGLTATGVAPDQVQLSWNPIPGASGYYVERSPDGSTWAQVSSTTGSNAVLTDGGLKPSTTYKYRIRAYSGAGISGYSAVASAATLSGQVNNLFADNLDAVSANPAWQFVGGSWTQFGGVLAQTSTATGDPRKALLTDQTYPVDVEITARVRVDSWVNGDYARAGVGLYTNAQGQGYNLVFHNDTHTVQFLDDSVAWGNAYSFNWTPGAWYWFDLKEQGGVLFGNVWADGTPEPAGWLFQQTGWSDRGGGAPALNGGSTGAGGATASFDAVSVFKPGQVSLSQSMVTLGASDLQAGSTTTVTLTARDARSSQEPSGGLSVAFGLGTGVGGGTFGAVTDLGNGIYTASFTATTAGSNTVIATIAGQPLSSAAPTLSVTPGPVSLAQSLVTVAAQSIQAGNSTTIELTAQDAYGNQEPSGGLVIAFGLGTGVGGGTFGAVTDLGNGLYMANFTATTAGSNTVIATIAGQPLSSAAPTLSVTPGPVSLAQSLVTAAAQSIQAGGSMAVKLTARDAYGNQERGGGLSVAFGLAAGSAGGTLSAVADQGNGTYTASFTFQTAGSDTIFATIAGQTVLNLSTLAVTPGSTSQLQASVVGNATAGQAFQLQVRALDAFGNLATQAANVIHLSTFNPSSELPADAPLVNGTGLFSVTLKTAGTWNVTATAPASPFLSASTNLFYVHPAPAASFQLSFPPQVSSQTPLTVEVTALDAYGNTAIGYLGTLQLSAGTGAELPPAYTFQISDEGRHTFTVSFATAGTQMLRATDSTLTGITGQQTITVSPVDPNRHFVAELYQQLLHRAPDVFGSNSWVALLGSGTTKAQVVQGFLSSREYNTNLVFSLYQTLLGRLPDPTGLQGGLDLLMTQSTVNGLDPAVALEAAIIGSAEYFQKRGGGTNDGFLRAVYSAALNRGVDPTGASAWGAALAGGLSRTAVAQALLTSREADQELVSDYYQEFLGRTADAGGLNSFVDALMAGTNHDAVITGFVLSAEFFGRN